MMTLYKHRQDKIEAIRFDGDFTSEEVLNFLFHGEKIATLYERAKDLKDSLHIQKAVLYELPKQPLIGDWIVKCTMYNDHGQDIAFEVIPNQTFLNRFVEVQL